MTTAYLDSNDESGINAPVRNRMSVRRQTTCSPIRAKDLVKTLPDVTLVAEDFVVLQFYLGPILSSEGSIIPYTNQYLTRSANATLGYTMM